MAENDAHYNGTFDMDTQTNGESMWERGNYDMAAPIPEAAAGDGSSMTASDHNEAVTLPDFDNGSMTAPGGNSADTSPEPENGNMTAPGDNGAVTLPELENGNMTAPGEGGAVTLPELEESNPIGSGPEWIPGFPIFPDSSPQYYGQVRFLNASTNSFPVNISIDGTAYAINSRFGTISNYDWVTDGFHTVTVRYGSGMRSILLQQNFPFVGGQKVTMVLTDSATGGLDMIRVADTGCSNMSYNTGCYRFANMAYSGSSFDLMLYGGETVFRSVGFQTVTPYKQAMAGTYQFFVTNANTYNTFMRELPVIVIGAIGTNANIRQPLVSFQTDINAGQNYTTYMLGNIWSDTGLIAMTVED